MPYTYLMSDNNFFRPMARAEVIKLNIQAGADRKTAERRADLTNAFIQKALRLQKETK